MKTIQRVLVVAPYGIGDLIFITPVLRALRLLPGIERVDMILGSRTEQVIRSNPHVDDLFPIDKDLFHRRTRKENFKEITQLTKILRERRYDLMLDYSMRPEYAFWAQYFLKIPIRSGFHYRKAGWFLTHRTFADQGFHSRSVVEFVCDVAHKVNIDVPSPRLEFYVSGDNRKAADQLLSRYGLTEKSYAVIAPGGGESWGKDAHFKRWPAQKFATLWNQLQPSLQTSHVVILGGAAEKSLGDEVCTNIDIPSVNLAGECSIQTSAGILAKARCLLTNDGGLVHIAHALQVPVAALFGPVDPKVYGPYPECSRAVTLFKKDLDCRPCYKRFRYNSACIHRDCLQNLTVEEAINQLIEKNWIQEVTAHV